MIKINKKLLCVILARGGSKGIPKKNIYILNNHPLISYSIYAGLNSKYIDKVVPSKWLIDEKFLNLHKVDLLVHGSDNPSRIPKKD